MKKLSIILISVLFTMLYTASWAADDLIIVNGQHWQGSSLQQKRAYLFGVGNVLEIEEAMAGDKYEEKRGRSIVPVLLEGMSGTSIADMVTKLDKFYADHPEEIKRTVIGVLYLEMALPNLKK